MKEKSKVLFIMFMVIAFFSACSESDSKEDQEEQTDIESISSLTAAEVEYENYVGSFQKNTSEELLASSDEESYFLYTGRRSCPYCLKFVPKLYYVSLLPDYKNITIRYLDSENKKDTTKEKFMDMNNIEYVPNFSYFQGNVLIDTMSISDQTTSKEIQMFIDNVK